MATVLITGITGTVGPVIAKKLIQAGHAVTGFSRRKPLPEKAVPGVNYVQGNFANPEDLKKLNGTKFDCLIHLVSLPIPQEQDAAVTFLSDNVAGHCHLFNYLFNNGCTKIVAASSIGASGCLDPDFIPDSIPIPPDHSTKACSHYSFSKAMLEEICRYYSRKKPDADIIVLRYGGIYDRKTITPSGNIDMQRIFCSFGIVDLDDVVNATIAAMNAKLTPGYHQYNVVGPDAPCKLPVAELLKTLFPEEIYQKWDLSRYQTPDGGFLPVFDMEPIRRDLGFVPQVKAK